MFTPTFLYSKQTSQRIMEGEFVATKLFIRDTHGFQIAPSFEDAEASDEKRFSLIVFRHDSSNGHWSVKATHNLKEREVVEEAPDSKVGHMDADTRSWYRAGPFRVEVVERTRYLAQGHTVMGMTLTNVEFEVDDQGVATSPAMQKRNDRLRREQEARDRASFRTDFHIDNDGHMYPRHLFEQLSRLY